MNKRIRPVRIVVPESETAALRRKVEAQRAWLKEREAERDRKAAERRARIEQARADALARWGKERPANVTPIGARR